MTVYRRPDPIPRRRQEPATAPIPLQSVRSETDDLHHLVSRKIFAAIADGHFPEGSILPNEHELGETLGVSRTALRESIKGLSSKGILETRRRRGTMVLDRRYWTQVDGEVITWSRRSNSQTVSDELWQALQSVLPTLAETAAGHALARRLPMPRLDTEGERHAAIAQFFMDIAGLSDNRFLSSVASIGLVNLVQDDPAFLRRSVEPISDEDIARLRDAIADGDAHLAGALMRALLQKKRPAGGEPVDEDGGQDTVQPLARST